MLKTILCQETRRYPACKHTSVSHDTWYVGSGASGSGLRLYCNKIEGNTQEEELLEHCEVHDHKFGEIYKFSITFTLFVLQIINHSYL